MLSLDFLIIAIHSKAWALCFVGPENSGTVLGRCAPQLPTQPHHCCHQGPPHHHSSGLVDHKRAQTQHVLIWAVILQSLHTASLTTDCQILCPVGILLNRAAPACSGDLIHSFRSRRSLLTPSDPVSPPIQDRRYGPEEWIGQGHRAEDEPD